MYVGANDGMLHAFNANNGDELWAFVPTPVIPNMPKLADRDYATAHLNYVNGDPIIEINFTITTRHFSSHCASA